MMNNGAARRLVGLLVCVALLAGAIPAMALDAFEFAENAALEVVELDEPVDGVDRLLVGLAGTTPVMPEAFLARHLAPVEGVTYGMLDLAGNDLDEGDCVATGRLVVAYEEGQEPLAAALVLRGDVLGRGKVDLVGLVTLASAMRGEEELEGLFLRAGDWNDNGKIDLVDLVMHSQAYRDAADDLVPTADEVRVDSESYDQPDALFTVEGVQAENGVDRVWFEVEGPDGDMAVVEAEDQGDGVWTAAMDWCEEFDTAGTYTVEANAKATGGTDGVLGSLTVRVEEGAVAGHPIMGESRCTVAQLVNLQLDSYSWDNAWYRMTVEDFCRLYYDICEAEGVRAEIAYAQMIQETGGLRYGNLVIREQHNFAGLGASGAYVPESRRKDTYRYTEDGRDAGINFASVENGIRSHVQHLKAYASSDDLVLEMAPEYDRFSYIRRETAPVVEKLAGTWAHNNAGYPRAIVSLSKRILAQSTQMPDYDPVIPPLDEPVRVRVSSGAVEVVYELNDSTAAEAFREKLPLTVSLEDDNASKWFTQPLAFDHEGSELAACEELYPETGLPAGAGLLAYDDTLGNVELFHSSFDPMDDRYAIGQAMDGDNALGVRDLEGDVTITEVGSAVVGVRVRMATDEAEVVYELAPGEAASSFVEALPMTVELLDGGAAMKSFRYDGVMDATGLPAAETVPGTLAYRNVEGGEILLYCGDGSEPVEPVGDAWKIGEAREGAENIGALQGIVTISLVEEEE